MAKAFLGTDLEATPHDNSKIYSWKRCHSCLFDMLLKAGIGYNHTKKCIEATDEAWESFVAVDGNVKGMRHQTWPYYKQWNEIFSKDQATGEGAETSVEAVNHILNEEGPVEVCLFEEFDKVCEGLDDVGKNVLVSQATTSACGAGSKSGKKRKVMESSSTMCKILGKFCETTYARLSDIAKHIGHDYNISTARKQIWSIVGTFSGMTLQAKLMVSRLLVKNNDELELFGSLPADARE